MRRQDVRVQVQVRARARALPAPLREERGSQQAGDADCDDACGEGSQEQVRERAQERVQYRRPSPPSDWRGLHLRGQRTLVCNASRPALRFLWAFQLKPLAIAPDAASDEQAGVAPRRRVAGVR